MADPFPYPAPHAAGRLVRHHGGPSRRGARFIAGKSGALLPPGNGDLHLGSVARSSEEPGRRRSTRGRIRMDTGAAGGEGPRAAGLAIAPRTGSRMLSTLRTLLVLGRVSNLPTVWSNCLAGWWLGGGGQVEKLPLLFVGATLLYVGGMYWNDAFDEEFDRQFRMERPIPAGAMSPQAVWRLGMLWLGIGALCLVCIGRTTGTLGLILLSC